MYIEFVILDNFLLTYLAGATAARLAKKRPSTVRLVIASIVGTGVAIAYPFMKAGIWAQILIKLALGMTLCVIMYFKTPRFLTSSLLFFGCTFAYGGASYAIGLIVFADASAAARFSAKYPLFLTLGTGAAVFLCSKYIIKRIRIAHARAPFEYDMEIELYGKCLKFKAFLDTGNCVFDEKSGLPLVITDANVFMQKLDAAATREFLTALDGLRRVTVRTAAGQTEARVLKPQRITVYSGSDKHTIDAMVGIVGGRRFSAEHEILIPVTLAEAV